MDDLKIAPLTDLYPSEGARPRALSPASEALLQQLYPTPERDPRLDSDPAAVIAEWLDEAIGQAEMEFRIPIEDAPLGLRLKLTDATLVVRELRTCVAAIASTRRAR